MQNTTMFETPDQEALLTTRPHFQMLDGLRGLAAVAVVVFHFMEIISPDASNSFIGHAYLAVDFFFCLSGFVIAYAYDQRLPKIGIGQFLKLRLIRLHPLVIIGSVIGILVFIFDPFSNLFQVYGDKSLLLFLTSCLMIPYPLVKERYFNIFHLNPPTWSLFFEYVANIVYALILVRLPKKALWVLTGIATAVLFYESKRAGSLVLGWSGDTFWGGGVRVGFSFLAGMLIYRSQWIIRNRLGLVGLGILLIAGFLFPYRNSFNWYVDPVLVAFYYPLIVMLGAGTTTSAFTDKICRLSGELSYPLYMIHYPFIWLFMSYVEKYKPGMMEMTWITIAGTILLTLLAYLVLKYIDAPIRNWLKDRNRQQALS
jgi:peptidoglycan/LPS O-acetylase OafA/YrhL